MNTLPPPPVSGNDRNSNERTVTVQASGVVRSAPDTAKTTVGVEATETSPKQAVAEISRVAKRIIDSMRELGIAKKDLRTSNIGIQPNNYRDKDKNWVDVDYTASYSLRVTIRDIALVADVLVAAVEAGANDLSGVSFSASDETAHFAEARKLAMAEAHDKATQLAEAADARLGPVKKINESRLQDDYYVMESRDMMYEAQASMMPPPIEVGESSHTVNVTVVWYLT